MNMAADAINVANAIQSLIEEIVKESNGDEAYVESVKADLVQALRSFRGFL